LKEYNLPIIALVLVIPLIISPNTIEAMQVEEMQVKAIVQFEYNKKIKNLETEIENQLEPNLTTVLNGFGNQTNATSYSFIENYDDIVYTFGKNQTTNRHMYEVYPEISLTLDTNMTKVNFESEYNILMLSIKQTMLDFLSSKNNIENVKVFLDMTWGSAETNETT